MAAGQGRLILFLHGFPEFSYSWRHQLTEFGRDHLAVALDLRGYNESDKPARRAAYGIGHLVADVAAAIRHFDTDRAALVGHDWGGGIAWAFAMRYPAMLDRLIILNAPHPARLWQEFRSPAQLRKSWYMFFFQLPVLPERLMTRRGAAALRPAYRRLAANPAAFSEDDIRTMREAFLKPGVATAAINYYRNLFGGTSLARSRARLEVPTLLIWGDRDPYLGIRLSQGLKAYVSHLTVRHIPDAGHFVHEEKPEEVNTAIRAFLEDSPPPAGGGAC